MPPKGENIYLKEAFISNNMGFNGLRAPWSYAWEKNNFHTSPDDMQFSHSTLCRPLLDLGYLN